ncbi:MAG: hypothetical protein P8M07_01275 [Flavobacteriales bacterium]|nr:hypothetical protein [Flavobacteriales bacterium]
MWKQLFAAVCCICFGPVSGDVLAQSEPLEWQVQGLSMVGVPGWAAVSARARWGALQGACAYEFWAGRGAWGGELRAAVELSPDVELWGAVGAQWGDAYVSLGGRGDLASGRLALEGRLPVLLHGLKGGASGARWRGVYAVDWPGGWRGMLGFAVNEIGLAPSMGLGYEGPAGRRVRVQWRGPWQGWLIRFEAPVEGVGLLGFSWAFHSLAPSLVGWSAAANLQMDAWDDLH